MIVINKAPRHHTIAHLCVLVPGTNNIPGDVWREAEKIPVIQHYIESGAIVVKPTELADLSVTEALDVIKNTYDPAALNKLGPDKRKRVIEAICGRKEELAALVKKATQKDT